MDVYHASMDPVNIEYENQLFSNMDNIVEKPSCFDSDSENTGVQRLDAANTVSGEPMVIGTGKLLKVMAGDHVAASVKGWYDAGDSNGDPNPTTPFEQLLAAVLSNGIMSTGTHSGPGFGTGGSSLLLPGVLDFLGTQDNFITDAAYLNWVLLDDQQFRMVTENGSSGFAKLEDNHDGSCNDATVLQINNGDGIDIPRNGYLYVYLSNTSDEHAVYFDQLHIEHTRGPLVEETHYYPFGLTMAGISSKAASNAPSNKLKYNGIEQNSDFDLNIGETFFRSHDPQIGRWLQIDPKVNETESPYVSMRNNPILLSDPLGDDVELFNTDGSYGGRIKDKKHNEAHFINSTGSSLLSLAKSINANDDVMSLIARFVSVAFIGENTIKDAKTLEAKADKEGHEIPFLGQTSLLSKEIRLKEVKTNKDDYNSDHKLLKVDEIISRNVSQFEQAFTFLVGHTHQRSLLHGLSWGSDEANHRQLGRPTDDGISVNTHENNGTGDYGQYLYRDLNSHVRGQSPALIVTHLGITIYGTGTSSAYNMYAGQTIVDNKVEPTKFSYLLYKKFK